MLVTLAVGLLAAWATAATDVGGRLEAATLDFRWGLRPTGHEDPRIVMVAITGEDLNRGAIPYPIPRTYHAKLITALSDLGADAIVYRFDFDQQGDDVGDLALLNAIAASDARVLLGTVSVDDDGPRFLGGGRENREQSGAIFAAGAEVPGADGGLRRMTSRNEHLDLPSITMQAALYLDGLKRLPHAPESEPWIDVPHKPCNLDTARIRCATTAYSASAVTAGKLRSKGLERSVVVVGQVGSESQALQRTWSGGDELTTGLELSAHEIGTVARGYPVRSSPRWLSWPVGAIVIAASALLAAWLDRRRERFLQTSTPWRTAIAVAGVGAAAVAAYVAAVLTAFAWADVVLPAAPVVVGALAVLSLSAARVGLADRRRAEAIYRTVTAMAPEQLIELIVSRNRGRAVLDPEKVTMTILFADLRGSTQLIRALEEPEKTYLLLQAFQQGAAKLVRDEEGFVQSFAGDGILAVLGLDHGGADHAARAMRIGLNLTTKLVDELRDLIDADPALAAIRPSADIRPVGIRVGINTGMVSYGTAGADDRYDFVTLGRTTHEASKLQGAARLAQGGDRDELRWSPRAPGEKWAGPSGQQALDLILANDDVEAAARAIVVADATVSNLLTVTHGTLAARDPDSPLQGYLPATIDLRDGMGAIDVWVRHPGTSAPPPV